MIILTNASSVPHKMRVVTSSAATVDVHASYMDNNAGTVTPGSQNTAISSATTTTIVDTPTATYQRNVKTVNIRNKHASTSVDVTVTIDVNTGGTVYELHSATLRAGEAMEYIEGVGFFVLAAATNPAVRVKTLTGDQSNSTTTPTELTTLSVTTGTGTFAFKYHILYQTSITTTGVKYSVNHTGTVTSFVADVLFVDTSATAATAAADQDSVLATGAIFGGFSARAKSTTGWGTTISADTVSADMFTIIEGLMIVTVDGDIELWHGSETAASTTVKAGTSLTLTRTGD